MSSIQAGPSSARSAQSCSRAAVARRQGYVLKRAPQRWFDVIVWPVVDAILFGAIGVYFGRQHGTAAASAAFLLAGIVLFHVVFQAEISLASPAGPLVANPLSSGISGQLGQRGPHGI